MTDVHALSGAYAIDALDDLERAKFERHLAELPRLPGRGRQPPRGLGPAGRDHRSVTPPASLRDSVLAGIDDGPADPAGRRRRGAAPSAVVAGGRPPGRRRGGDGRDRRRRRGRPDPGTTTSGDRVTVAEQVLRDNDAKRIVPGVPGRLEGDRGRSPRRWTRRSSSPRAWQLAPAGPSTALVPARRPTWSPPASMPDGPDDTRCCSTATPRRRPAVGITVEPEGTSPDEPTTKPIALFSIPT